MCQFGTPANVCLFPVFFRSRGNPRYYRTIRTVRPVEMQSFRFRALFVSGE
jgi:hypothetical protein